MHFIYALVLNCQVSASLAKTKEREATSLLIWTIVSQTAVRDAGGCVPGVQGGDVLHGVGARVAAPALYLIVGVGAALHFRSL